MPVTLLWLECRTRNGTRFKRANVEKIGKNPQASVLTLDNCKIDEDVVIKSGWQTEKYNLPRGTEENQTLTTESGQGAQFSLETKIAGAEVAPKADVKVLKKTETSYTLVGPHRYLAYLPKNRTAYSWNWK